MQWNTIQWLQRQQWLSLCPGMGRYREVRLRWSDTFIPEALIGAGTVLGTENPMMIKADMFTAPIQFTLWRRKYKMHFKNSIN